jgi:hypothetical protein
MKSNIQPPEYVYIPAEDYSISVEIRVPKTGTINEWIPLRASRRSGPWKRVRSSEISAETKWYSAPLPAFEEEVADNLDWSIDPPQLAQLDVTPIFPGHVRAIRFKAPGVYTLQARNAFPTQAESNVVSIRIDTD